MIQPILWDSCDHCGGNIIRTDNGGYRCTECDQLAEI
ncbi:tRNA(Ile2) C34 agmatinyltransferase TiaS [Croceifilum oryzae]|uniref:tRNA(Ile2) C34 agmatinyltransferase TiaS n=1 Tax=Croceifilum oryzae TaxID=1553429 RepID=A0AAJ1TGC4_9BACL|nr:tRNA(Ile2) C34 agmatinyltransferase TiaS [Croceifilum oryzae]